eukprot:3699375-Rhodomonas_salina.1
MLLWAGMSPRQIGTWILDNVRRAGPGSSALECLPEELRRYGADAYPSAVACNHPTVAFGIQFDDQQAKLDLREFSRQGTNEYYLTGSRAGTAARGMDSNHD